MRPLPFFRGGVAVLIATSLTAVAAPSLSEIQAIGNTTFLDEDGDTPDWIEICNPDAVAVDLAGYHLTDDPGNLTKWTFPATTVAGGGYLVVFASDKDRAVAGSELHANFKLSSSGEYLALVAPGGTAVVSEFSPNFPPQVDGYSYGIDSASVAGYFDSPTPGTANGVSLAAPLLAPTISPGGQMFVRDARVDLETSVPNGQIRYTTDGSVPTATSTLYEAQLRFTQSTHLRARVFDPVSGEGGAVAGEHFVRLAFVSEGGLGAPHAFTSNLPIMVIDNFDGGTVPGRGQPLQTARISVHDVDPGTGRSRLLGTPDATMRMGFRRRGASSSGFPKPQYRVELRDELDEDLDYPLVGLPSDSDWVFNGPWTDKALIRNPMAFKLGRTVGIEAPRTGHFELFLNTDGGDVEASDYMGVYYVAEKIKSSKDRVDIETLDPGDNSAPEITGGYLLRFEPPGIADDGPRATNWTSVEIIEPEAPTQQQRDYISDYLDDFVATLGWARGGGANNSGTINPDPVTGYPAYIDVDSFVHLFLINELLRDQDAYVRSDYMYKDRNGKLFKGPLWDYNLITGTGCCFDNRNPEGWQYQDNYNRGGRDHSYEPDWFVPLMRDRTFRQQFIDRWFELRQEGILKSDNLFAMIDELADPLAEAAVRNFTKWDTLGSGQVGFPTPVTATWEEQVVFIKDWLTTRMAWIDGQFLSLTAYSHPSGVLTAGTQVTLTGDTGWPIFYTVDGTDPRTPGGRNSATSIRISSGGSVTIDSSVDLIARSFDGTEWSAPSKVTYIVGSTPADASTLAVTELNYHPADPTPAEQLADPNYNDDDFEFVELKNIGSGEIDLGGVRFTDGISYAFPAATLLQPGDYILIVEDLAAFEERYGTGLPVVGVYSNKMSNDGETMRLVDIGGTDIAHFTFNDIWYRATDGRGYSLVARDEDVLPGDYNLAASWRPSGGMNGSPGVADALTYAGWLVEQFTDQELADPLISGPWADCDLDGLVTLMEFALGLDPKSPVLSGAPVGLVVRDGSADYLALSFRRLKGYAGLSYRVKASSDLITWNDELAVMVGAPVDNGDGTETVTVRDNVPVTSQTSRYVRLEVEEVP